MSRLKQLFESKKGKVLNIYITAGYPKLGDTVPIMQALQQSGADIIELGMPYSDPLADGPVIQQSSSIAIENGMSIATLFTQLKDMRSSVSIPVILMGYMNPVLQYGFEKFCADAAAAGIDGLILPDLPEYEFETEYGAIIKKYGLDFIFLVTPETSEERVRKLDALSSGFLYAVSSSSTTGGDKDFSPVQHYLQRLQSYQLRNPFLVGFGVKDKASFAAASQFSHGAIVGSAFIKALEGKDNVTEATTTFIQSLQ